MVDEVVMQLQDQSPRFNSRLCEGLAVEQLKEAPMYIEQVVRALEKGWPSDIQFVGCYPCTPLEQFQRLTNLSKRHNTYEITDSDVYMVRLDFRFRGEIMSHHMLLPYAKRGNVIELRSSRFVISPAVVDNFFSIEDSNIFIPFTGSRNNFSVVKAWYRANGTELSVDVVYSKLYNAKKDEAVATKDVHSVLANYLFAYYGVTETFKRFFDTDVVFGTTEITKENYPTDQWVICETSGNCRFKKKRETQTNIRIAVKLKPEEFEKDRGVASMVGGLFYILDNVADFGFVEADYLDMPRVWQRALLRFIFRKIESEKKALEQIRVHLDSIESYVDQIEIDKMRFEGIEATTTNELFAHLIKNFNAMTGNSNSADRRGKVLAVTRFVLYDIVKRLQGIKNELVRLTGPRLNKSNVDSIFNSKFPVDTILNISNHGEVNNLESASDCLLYKQTLPVISQTRATGKSTANKASEMDKPENWLHPSICEAHSYLAITKSVPVGDGKANPMINLGERDEILAMPGIEDLMENLGELLS